jgi:hypothetical protein
MAAPPPARPDQGAEGDEAGLSFTFFGLVRDIRAEAQNLVRMLDPVRAALQLQDPTAQQAELARTLVEADRVIAANETVIDERIAAVRDLFAKAPRLYDGAGDAVTELENQWREMRHALSWPSKFTAIDIASRIDGAETHFREIEWQAALVTVPNRVRQHLRTKRVGGQLRFHDAFRDEITDEAQRVRLLSYLSQHAASFSGVVDVPSGVIYRVAPKPRRRVASWVAIGLLATVGGYLFVLVLTRGLPEIQLTLGGISGITPERFSELMGAYWGLLIGAVTHIVVEAIKQQQRGDSSSFLALEDWFLWVHVRETSLIVGVLGLYVVLVGLAVTLTTPGSLTFLTAFGAGYSFDSILGLFITRFDSSAKSMTETVVGRLPSGGAN